MLLRLAEGQRSSEQLEAIRRAALAFDYYNAIYPAVLSVRYWSHVK